MGCDRFVWTKLNMPDPDGPGVRTERLSINCLKLLSVVTP
jgi:hypothetical protein